MDSSLQEALVQLLNEVVRRPGLQEVLQTAVLRMTELFAVERVSVVMFDSKGDLGFVVMEREQQLLDNIVIRLADYPELMEVIQKRQELVISDVFGDTLLEGVRDKLTSAQQQHRSALLFPLMRRDNVVGAMFLRHRGEVPVTQERLQMARLLTSVTSIAIGHALEQEDLLSERRALERSNASVMEQLEGLQDLREFLDRAKDGVVVTDLDGVIRYTNGAAAQVLATTQQQLLGRNFGDLVSPHYRAVFRRALVGNDVADDSGYVDLQVTTRGGEASVILSAAVRSAKKPAGVFISFRDVTSQREIEGELRQTKDFLENLIQSSVDAIIATDTEGQIILFNRAAEQILGYSAQEVVGRLNVSSLYPRGDAWDVMRKLRSEAYGGAGRLQLVRKELVANTGEVVPVNLTAAMIYEDGKEVATVSIFSDLRERRRIEEKLSQVQRKLQMTERQAVAIELAGAAAHELNQPLTSILGYAEILKRRMPVNESTQKAVETIIRETERMAGIVKRIGQLTAYQTKSYVGSSQILDIAAKKTDEPGNT